MFLFLTIISGLAIGSFLSVLTYRIETNKPGIFLGRSSCPDCKKQLQPKDLVPLFSYLFNKGKCRFCNKSISIQYPLLELTTSLVFTLIYFKFSHDLKLFFGWIIIFTLAIAISKTDIKTQLIPFKLSIPLGIFSLFFSFFILQNSPTHIILSSFLGFSFFYLQYLISKGKWTGLGDADIGFIIGSLSTPFLLLQTLTTSYILGSIVGITLILLRKSKFSSKLAFGPFLFLALLLNTLYPEQITQLFFPFS